MPSLYIPCGCGCLPQGRWSAADVLHAGTADVDDAGAACGAKRQTSWQRIRGKTTYIALFARGTPCLSAGRPYSITGSAYFRLKTPYLPGGRPYPEAGPKSPFDKKAFFARGTPCSAAGST